MEEDLGGRRRRRQIFEKCVYGCCPPSLWIRITALIHILLYTCTAVVFTVAMILPNGGFSDIVWSVAFILFIPVALSIPVTPALFLAWAIAVSIPGGKFPHELSRLGESMEYGLTIWMEIVVLMLFVLMATILLAGLKKKSPFLLNAWLGWAGLSIGLILVETIVFVVMELIHFSDTMAVTLTVAVLIRAGLSSLILLGPLGAVSLFKGEIRANSVEQEKLQLSGEIVEIEIDSGGSSGGGNGNNGGNGGNRTNGSMTNQDRDETTGLIPK